MSGLFKKNENCNITFVYTENKIICLLHDSLIAIGKNNNGCQYYITRNNNPQLCKTGRKYLRNCKMHSNTNC